MKNLKEYFKAYPVIAGVRGNESIKEAVKSNVLALFLLNGNIMQLDEIMRLAKKHNKLIFLHIDLIKGIGRDRAGVKYLAEKKHCDGIVTTKSYLIKAAKKENLMAVQRLFLLDSCAVKTGKHLLENYRPDAVEILPGIAAPYFIKNVEQDKICPVIAGGLIREKEEIDHLLEEGVMSVSISNHKLWNYKK